MSTSPLIVRVRALTDDDRRDIAQWRYAGDLSVYDPGDGAAQLHAPDHVALEAADGRLLGYGTFGHEAQVPGGDYPNAPNIVDLGMGLDPDLVGRGHGAAALRALIEVARHTRSATRIRVTVAPSNPRATALVTGAGFVQTHAFVRERDGRAFTQYERAAVQRATRRP